MSTPSAEPTREQLEALADTHLPADLAAEWKALLKPSLRLRAAAEGDSVIGHLGGLPGLGEQDWPEWPGQGPLSHILSVLTPDDGVLAFFYRDDQEITVGPWDASTRPGSRVLACQSGAAETPAPEGAKVYSRVPVTAVPTITWAHYEHPRLLPLWQALDPGTAEAFEGALGEILSSVMPVHQLSGHPLPVQGSVEFEVAQVEQRSENPDVEPDFSAEEFRTRAHPDGWHLLAQVDSDRSAGFRWGDGGTLYFMIRPADLAAKDFGKAAFTWQCS